MISASTLHGYTSKDLAQMAKKKGVAGWHAMNKGQLVQALVRMARKAAGVKASRGAKPPTSKASTSASSRPKRSKLDPAAKSKAGGRAAPARPAAARSNRSVAAANASEKRAARAATSTAALRHGGASVSRKPARPVSVRASAKRDAVQARLAAEAAERLRQEHAKRRQWKDLGVDTPEGVSRDRIVLACRDSFWLQACWEITRQSVERAKAAMAEDWHAARPTLRVLELDSGTTTSTAERVARDIAIHGGASTWYVSVNDPAMTYQVAIGYLAVDGKFYCLARSNPVSPPRPGCGDVSESDLAHLENIVDKPALCPRAHLDDGVEADLSDEFFEDRLARPLGVPPSAQFGLGAERMNPRERGLRFEVDAEMIIFGSTKPDARVTLGGDPVKVRSDGTFTVRMSLPNRRQVLPIVAYSSDGVEQRTVVLAIERNTKTMEPMLRDQAE